MAFLSDQGLWVQILAFCAAAAVILAAGTRLAGVADRLADATGLAEALTGALVLGAATSLSGIVTSVWAAAENHPDLAMSNALGGIAAQTFFLAVADMVYRRANLEHAAASLSNLISGTVLIVLLCAVLVVSSLPPVSVLSVHPLTPVLVMAYLMGLRVARNAERAGAWQARQTRDTKRDDPDESPSRSAVAALLPRFAVMALFVGLGGYVVGESGYAIVRSTGLAESLVGALMTAVATSLPELVTTVAAVRRGALTLAVGGIIGGNAFDVLLVAFSDAAYRPGSIYHALAPDQAYLIALTALMTAILLMGLLRRERHGPGNIGFESALILAVYAGGMTGLWWIA